MVSLMMVGETLWVRLVLPGAVEKFGRQWLYFEFSCFVVLEGKKIVVMFLLVVDSLSTGQLVQIEVYLKRVKL